MGYNICKLYITKRQIWRNALTFFIRNIWFFFAYENWTFCLWELDFLLIRTGLFVCTWFPHQRNEAIATANPIKKKTINKSMCILPLFYDYIIIIYQSVTRKNLNLFLIISANYFSIWQLSRGNYFKHKCLRIN